MAVYFRRQEGERIELSTPHIVIWTHGVGLGCDLVAGLETHPVLVSEVRGISEAQRAASGPLAMLVVLVGLSENDRRIDEVTKLFPGVAVLVISDCAAEIAVRARPPTTQVRVISAEQSLELLCWHVAEALSRIPLYHQAPARHLGPVRIELDRQGTVDEACRLGESWFYPGPHPRPGHSLLPLLEENDRPAFASHLARAAVDHPAFFRCGRSMPPVRRTSCMPA